MSRLSRTQILEYALTGAVTERGVQSGNMSESEEEALDADIKELERRLERAKTAELQKLG